MIALLENRDYIKRTEATLQDQAKANITFLSIKEYSHICMDETVPPTMTRPFMFLFSTSPYIIFAR